MDILIVTDDGACLGFADRLNSEGNSVQVYPRKPIGSPDNRLFKLQDNLQKGLHESKFVISDIPSWDFLDQRAKYTNRPALGASSFAALPNTDAFKQFLLFKRFELPIPPTDVLDDIGDAIQTALDWDAHRTVIRYADREFKCDYKDWLAWGLMRIPLGQKILLQQLVLGQEVVLTGWFDGIEWLDAFSIAPLIDFELNKFAAVAPINADKPIVAQTLKRLESYFAQASYCGPVHLELVVTDKDFVVQRLQIGFQFPLDYTILEFIQGNLTRFFSSIAFPSNAKPVKTRDYVGVVQSQCVRDDLVGAPILGVNPERLKHLVFHNVSLDMSDGTYQLAGKSGNVVTGTAHGPSVDEMCTRVYTTVEAVKFPEKHYNNNLGAVVAPTFEKLKSWGYLHA